ncbi:GW dipeptide domain-containing protein, partial [Carnobacterium sp.]|uniref:GW dipeptide domain-containing protein n=1 Tax=Carnobacterium sp. TaxID=48221 RepID=UPI0028AAC11E
MHNWKKPLQKLLTITMVFSLLSPMILSTGVSAAENKEPIQEKAESTVIETESSAENEPVEENINIEEEVPKEEIDNLESSEDKLSDEKSNEDAIGNENTSEESSTSSEEQETSNSKIEDYFSLAENRENAIAIMKIANVASDSSDNKSESTSIINNFIENVSTEAIAAAGEYHSFASVLIAQAALESAWGTSALIKELESYNLFGVKASEAEDFVQYYSKVADQENTTLENVKFKKYSSYKEAFAENLLKLQQNPEWKSFKDSADSENYKNILHILSEEYSNVPNYENMLNTIIETYDLTQYDKSVSESETESDTEEEVVDKPQQRSTFAVSVKKAEVITSEKTIDYRAKINRKTDTINTKPYGTEGYKRTAWSSEYYGQEVKISKEAVTNRATWALISINGKELGWIDKAGLDIEKVTSSTDTSYYKRIGRKTDSISTLPWGTEGFKVVEMSSQYLGKQVKIIKEAKTRRATWALITLNGKELGWIDKKGLTDYEIILSEKTTNYKAKINRKTDTINTKPYGTQGYKILAKSSEYYENQVTITKEAVTDRATWAYISGLGWMDKAGLTIEKITSQTNTNYKARITRSTDTINTKPWGTEGYQTVAYSKDYFGGEVTVTKEAKTSRATWALIAFNGKELGWIDIKALKKINLSKKVVVIDPGHGGKDPGAQAGGVKEATLNLIVAKKVQQKLEKAGYEVIMTRTTDKFLELSEIAGIANRSNADIFVSVHTNSFNGTANGIETYSYNKAGNPNNLLIANDPQRLLNSSLLSQNIQNSLIRQTGAFDRKAQKANFHVVRETGMPAVLVEIGFVDNTVERNKLVTNAYQEKIATGIVEGIQ